MGDNVDIHCESLTVDNRDKYYSVDGGGKEAHIARLGFLICPVHWFRLVSEYLFGGESGL